MKVFIKIFFLSIFITATFIFAQNPNGVIRCATYEYMELKKSQYPDYKQRLQQLENDIQQNILNKGSADYSLIRIPVVVHIVYKNTDENLSLDQINSQITILNQDYRRLPDSPGFNDNPIGADVKIEFYLADEDPDGNPTTGVTRTSTSNQYFSYESDNVKYSSQGGIDAWPADKYLNIWVCDIRYGTYQLLGYAQFPNYPGTYPPYDYETDGVVVHSGAFGNTGYLLWPDDFGLGSYS